MRGIRSKKQFEEMVRHLTHPVAGKAIFDSMRTLVCFAAVLGFEYGKRTKLEADYFEAVDGRIFENSVLAQDLLYLIALASEKNADILRDENEERMITVFEEYAQGGLEILEGWLREKPEDTAGDRAILSALHKYDFLSVDEASDVEISNISF